MCKKHTCVSHSPTGAEIISLDAGLRMDGIPAFDLWDLVVEVLHCSSHQAHGNLQRNRPSSKHINTQIKTRIQRNDLEFSNVDYVSSNVKSFRSGAMLYILRINEAVVKMIIKSRSSTMRHVSRTHRVALDWLFDENQLGHQIQIKYVETKKQLADILTKRNFTPDEWNHLLCLFNISKFSSASCPQTMSKRKQGETGEERIVAKSRPTLRLISKTVASSLTAQSSSASNCEGIFKGRSQSLSLIACAV